MNASAPAGAARRILVVFGTRPEAIKMMPVLRVLRGRPGIAVTALCTGQHREMVDQVLTAFGERADIDLGLMAPGQSLSALAAGIMRGMDDALAQAAPDLVLVQGDTTTAFAAAVAAFHAGVPVGHVEAGLRSHDLRAPWPEEFYRVAIDGMATLRFAPTAGAAAHLSAEYNRAAPITVTGNTGIDALLEMAGRIARDGAFREGLEATLPGWQPGRKEILVTSHRRESFGAGLDGICHALEAIAARGGAQIIYPVHRNPRVADVVQARLCGTAGIHLLPPLPYPEMVLLMTRAHLVLTDSGGMQEEAPALGKPVLVMRDVTERPEALATGVAKLVGTDAARIVAEVSRLLDDPAAHAAMARPVFPYGDGQAARRIADAIDAWGWA